MTEQPGSAYLAWNDALAARFFSADMAGQAVYLFVTEDVLQEVGRPFGRGVDDFLASVRDGPPGATRTGHCQRALHVADRWRERGFVYPPYIAYLGLFVLAGGLEGEFDPRSYYPRVWELLGEAGDGTPPSFHRMLDLWDDLEKWSVRDMDGTLGLFEARIVGGKIHIGLPLAQTMLTEEERGVLPRVFADAGLEPGSVPTDRELRRALAIQGRSVLRRRTLQALEHEGSTFAAALFDVVSDDFLEWNGEVPEEPGRTGARREVSAGLRLCLAIDRVAQVAQTSLRCHSNRDFREGGLELQADSSGGTLVCTEFIPGWSDPLVRASGGRFIPEDAAWKAGLTLADPTGGWTLKLRPSQVRVFVDGRAMQLPGMVETLDIPRDEPFLLAFHSSVQPRLESWLGTDCVGWEPIQLLSGFPAGWTLGSIRHATTDSGPRVVDDRFGFPDRLTLRLAGGIPGAVRNTFFSFGPPDVVMAGAVAGDTVTFNGQPLEEDPAERGRYVLPGSLPLDSRIGIEARRGDEVLKRKSLYLISGVPWLQTEPEVGVDGYGRPVEAGADGIGGACVPDLQADPMPVDPLRTPGLRPAVPRVYFVGRTPGQLTEWPAEPLPEWEPIWAIPFGQRGRALYCGGPINAAGPTTGAAGGREGIRRWHAVLWRWRKRITPPQERALKVLWRRYVEAARNV